MACPDMPTVGQVPETNATPLPLSAVWMSSMEAPAPTVTVMLGPSKVTLFRFLMSMTMPELQENPSYEWPPQRTTNGRLFALTQTKTAETALAVEQIANNAGASCVRAL